MKFHIFLILSFIHISLPALESDTDTQDAMVINSGIAEYNGTEISLVGNVVIEHGLGKINTHKMTLLPSPEKKLKFSHLKMEDDIHLEIKNGGHLYCQQAELDYIQLKGHFFGNQKQPDVTYMSFKNSMKGKDKIVEPLIIKSTSMQAELARDQEDQISLKELRAGSHVRVHYNNNYLLVADQAVYRCLNNQNFHSGFLTLTMNDPLNSSCILVHQNGDRIKAQQVTIDTQERQVICFFPKGNLHFFQNDPSQPILNFSSDQLVWDDAKQILFLQKNVQADLGEIGTLQTQEIQISQKEMSEKKRVNSLTALGETELSYKDKNQELVHKLVTHGSLFIDRQNKKTLLTSPINELGEVIEGKQVYFEDLMGDIFADQIEIDYLEGKGGIELAKLTMLGHVKILNRFDGHLQESGSVLHYAIADRVEYYPGTQEMLLASLESRRVLFYDKVNNIQMSAPSLKIKRDGQSKKGSIKGIGDVRFTFIEKEFEQLRERFNLKGS